MEERKKDKYIILIALLGLLLFLFPFTSALYIDINNQTSGGGSTIVNVTTVSAGNAWIDVTGGYIISLNTTGVCPLGYYAYGFNTDGTLQCRQDTAGGSGFWVNSSSDTITPQTGINYVDMSLQNVSIGNLTVDNYNGILKATAGWVQTASDGTDYWSPTSLVNQSQLVNDNNYLNWSGVDNGTFYKDNTHNYWNDTYATFNKTYADTLYLQVSENGTIVRAGTYNCPVGQALVNVTVNQSGIFGQCQVVTSGNPFDQVLNITSNVTHYNQTVTNLKIGTITGLLKAVSGWVQQAIDGVDFWSPSSLQNLSQLNDNVFGNSSIARTGNCPTGQVVQNTTTGGVQCVDATVFNATYYNRTQVDALIPANLKYYFYNITATGYPAGYTIMNTTISPRALNSTTTSGLVDGQTLATRVNPNTNLTRISSGVITGHTHATKTAGVKDLQLYGEIWNRLANGTEISLTNTSPSAILVTGVLTEINLMANIQETNLNVNDVLVWRLKALVSGAGSAPTVQIDVENGTFAGLSLPVSATDLQVNEVDPKWSGNATGTAYMNTINFSGGFTSINGSINYNTTTKVLNTSTVNVNGNFTTNGTSLFTGSINSTAQNYFTSTQCFNQACTDNYVWNGTCGIHTFPSGAKDIGC